MNHLAGGQALPSYRLPASSAKRPRTERASGSASPCSLTSASPGQFAWGDAASTAFWIDPKEDLIVIFMTQLLPSSTYPIRRELQTMVNAAIVD